MAPIKILFLRHFKPKMEKDRHASEWGLDYSARQSLEELLSSGKLSRVGRIISSPEKKALLTAKEISERLDLPLDETPLASEIDRRKSGFIDGGYFDVVSRYLSEDGSEASKIWESIPSVRNRARKLIALLSGKEENALLVVTHGMFLSIILSKAKGTDASEEWKNIGTGALIEMEFSELERSWMSDS